MTSFPDEKYWQTMQALLSNTQLVVDRPRGRAHPRYPELVYPLDYGYLDGTTAADGQGIDVWIGTSGSRILTGILCTFDIVKRDAEIKLLAGCSRRDVETILRFNATFICYLYIPRPQEQP
jgi:inorganic pyrophosphatase